MTDILKRRKEKRREREREYQYRETREMWIIKKERAREMRKRRLEETVRDILKRGREGESERERDNFKTEK